MTAMTLSEIASFLALAAIPVSVVTARWQLRAQVETTRNQARIATYRIFQASLNQFRRTLIANEVDLQELFEMDQDVHDGTGPVLEMGPPDVARLVHQLGEACGKVTQEVRGGLHGTREARQEAWRTTVQPLRIELNQAIRHATGQRP
ncbi:hypothetical protein [Streptomyces sp. NPDC057199]|uniref:hypothetical protein n=1 Tax=Streptomyces sp. NPDC057199 TaxID=3346047 RepID=UPI0036435C6C